MTENKNLSPSYQHTDSAENQFYNPLQEGKDPEQEKELHALCKPRLRAIHDTMDLLSGKWKVAIIGYLHTMGKCRFMQLQRNIEGIGAKMLSKELKDLEINELVTRTVLHTRPVTVEYELTDYGKTLQNIINELCSWGFKHRERILKRQTECTCGENPELGCEAHHHEQQQKNASGNTGSVAAVKEAPVKKAV